MTSCFLVSAPYMNMDTSACKLDSCVKTLACIKRQRDGDVQQLVCSAAILQDSGTSLWIEPYRHNRQMRYICHVTNSRCKLKIGFMYEQNMTEMVRGHVLTLSWYERRRSAAVTARQGGEKSDLLHEGFHKLGAPLMIVLMCIAQGVG